MTKEAHEKGTDLIQRLEHLNQIKRNVTERGLLHQYMMPTEDVRIKDLYAKTQEHAIKYVDACIQIIEEELDKL